ncbi:hypothetical protein AKJ56_01065 [candidate division MSBL1 archaeon SCGC-AAA382N08]|uniref:N-acetyltransferase domain-containing protein n=1 Tax=candidate division MSBL1 archaeon SCGC-AAA382N08 TaxID=1698285 RepID=A0A133VQ14_9EURY|nr:hypothetical protein AKJ56_01065 [candidate division MSBL1 archaeon SCGC-AAA382N08]
MANFDPSYVNEIIEIEEEVFQDPWPGSLLRRIGKRNPKGFKVAISENRILGYAVGRVETKNGTSLGHLMDLAVDMEYRRRGVGSALLKEIGDYFEKKEAEGAWLEMRKGHQKARKFYQQNGYEKFDVKEGYYSDGTNAVIMSKELDI